MYRRDVLMHYGIKGMKWRRRKSALYKGAEEGVTNVYSARQKQLSAQRGASAADALSKSIKNAKKATEKPSSKLRPKTKKSNIVDGVNAGISAGTGLRNIGSKKGSKSSPKPKVSQEYLDELESNSKKNKYPKKMKKG